MRGAAGSGAAAAGRGAAPVAQRRVTVAAGAGVDLSVAVWGPAGSRPDNPLRPVLLVHGLASNARLWDGVAALLAAEGHPVAAVDQRGHGLSSKPETGYDFDTLAADLLAVVDGLGWEGHQPVVAGQSWGGNVVLHLAARHQSRVAGLVLVDGGTIELSRRFPSWEQAASALAPPPLDGVEAAAFEDMIRRSHPDWPETGIAGTLANVEVLADGTIRPRLSRENHMTILRHLWEHHPSDLFPLVVAPAVLLMARGGVASPDELAAAATSLRSCEVRWVDGDHDIHAQHPGLVASAIGGLC